jgi:hypothetical protein
LRIEHFDDLLDGYYDEALYFHTPSHVLSGLTGGWRLDQPSADGHRPDHPRGYRYRLGT